MKFKNIIGALSLFLIFFLIGGEFHYREIFPYGGGLRNKLNFLKKQKLVNTELCTKVKYRITEFEFFLSKVKAEGQSNKTKKSKNKEEGRVKIIIKKRN